MVGMLEGRSIIVTGAAQGLGLAISRMIAREGGSVLMADILDNDNEVVQQAVASVGDTSSYVRCDVTQASQVRETVQHAVSRFGSLDGLVNNAGVGITGPITEITEQQFDTTVAVNLKGVFLFLQQAIRQMLKQSNGGSIVNIGSAGSVVGTPELMLYAMSKHGVAGITRCAGVEYAEKGIRVNSVCPGPLWTDMMQTAAMEMYGTDDPAEIARKQHVPRGKLGMPDEAAEAVVWLLSERSKNCNGSMLMTDGGYTAW